MRGQGGWKRRGPEWGCKQQWRQIYTDNGQKGRSSIVIVLSFDITFVVGCESKLCVPTNRFFYVVFGCNFIELRFEELPDNKGCEKQRHNAGRINNRDLFDLSLRKSVIRFFGNEL